MTTLRYSAKKIADLEAVLPGITQVWKAIKQDTGTRCRCPKSMYITDEAKEVCENDGAIVRRYGLDLATMELSGGVHVSTGEWATANRGEEKAVQDVPATAAVITVIYHDYYRYCSMDIQVAPGAIPASLCA